MQNIDHKEVFTNSSRQGMTLVEVMVGVMIIGLVVAGFLTALPQLRKTAIKSDMAQTASMLINSQMEELRTMQFDSVKVFSLPLNERQETINGHLYEKSVEVLPVTINGVSGEAVEVTVTLSWTLQGQALSSTSWTVFTKDGLSDKYYSDAN